MADVVYKIKNTAFAEQDNSQIMIVNTVLNGEAVSLITDHEFENENNINTNFTHAASVPNLVAGDKVIVQKISNYYVITDKLRNPGDKPTTGFDINEDGSLSLDTDVSIILKTLNAKIEISANGKIKIDGKEVYSFSNGVNKIQGTSIELN